MKKNLLLGTFALLAVLRAPAQEAAPPQATISNGPVQARLYLPDPKTGYYRGGRFDWSGVVAGLTAQNHTYFGVWFDTYDPTLHDAITGPVEEFKALHYDEAKPGETFVKIGVGVLRKKDDKPYHFATPYELVDTGAWTVTPQADRVQFAHRLTGPAGYAYEYEKTVRLAPGKPQMVLEHRLKNTGQQRIESTVYNHNFLILDGQPAGPDYVMKFPFDASTPDPGKGILQLDDRVLSYLRTLNKGESVYLNLGGYGTTAQDYDFRVENRRTGAGVRIRGDRPLARMAFWTNPANLSPEPYLALNLAPGEETTWTISYEFYELP